MTTTIIPGDAVYGRAAFLGFVAGLRSQLPHALLALAANRGVFAAGAPAPLSLLRSRGALVALGLAAAGELVADKLPATPTRTEPAPLGGRVLSGALAGAAVGREAGASVLACAALGAAGAVAGSFGGASYRRIAGETTGLPDPVLAVAEDATAVGLAAVALRPAVPAH